MRLTDGLRRIAAGMPPLPPKRRQRTTEEILARPSFKEVDVVISSFGRHPFDLKRASGSLTDSKKKSFVTGGVMTRRLTESTGRKWDDDDAVPVSDPQSGGSISELPAPSPYRKWINMRR